MQIKPQAAADAGNSTETKRGGGQKRGAGDGDWEFNSRMLNF